ncbi:DNA cytosine methyltransferase [Micromonospora haikouensis]|uniref:DNA cytosine methyltransferase n=1 Tax=Micromonospora haikouensis TaxID=686309 RepID=UPI003D72019D
MSPALLDRPAPQAAARGDIFRSSAAWLPDLAKTLDPGTPAWDGDITVTDFFCGAGGSTSGLHLVPGVRVIMASNHWQLALDTHNANHPHTDHDIESISQVDPRRYPSTTIGWFSPECTTWSVARGEECDYDDRPVQLDLLDAADDEPLPDEAKQRSRAQMEDVVRFSRHHRYLAVIVENVTDILKWKHLDRWLAEMRAEGYHHRTVILNSAFAQAYGPGAPQLRDRVYFVFWLAGQVREPNWDKWLRPRAYCPTCDSDVTALQVIRPGKRRTMRYGPRAQYHYRCPQTTCRGAVVHPYALPAAAAIDLSKPGRRIGDLPRTAKKPFGVAPNTYHRIEAGLVRHVGPLLTSDGGTRRKDAALVVPLRNNGVARPISSHPLMTVAAGGTHHALVMRNMTARGDQGQMSTPLDEPLRTLTAEGRQSLIDWQHAVYEYDSGHLRPVGLPLPTQTTVAGDALVRRAINVDDCLIRMLDVDEVRGGMAFAPGYILLGTQKKWKIRMLGNAVTPCSSRDLGCAVVEAITGVDIDPVGAR